MVPSFRLRACHLSKYLKPQFKEYVSNILPNKIFEMKKKGFSMPTEKWVDEKPADTDMGLKTTDPTQLWYLKMLREIEAQ